MTSVFDWHGDVPLGMDYVSAPLRPRLSEFRLRGAKDRIILCCAEKSLAHVVIAEAGDRLAVEPWWSGSSRAYHLLQHIHWCGALYDEVLSRAAAQSAGSVSVPTFAALPVSVAGVKPNIFRSLHKAHDPAAYAARFPTEVVGQRIVVYLR